MPQVEVKYSNDLKDIDFTNMFNEIEQAINEFDNSAGVCKSRGIKADVYRHTHVYISIVMMRKSHRDQSFMETLQDKLHKIIEKYIPENCHYSFDLDFVGEYYFTGLK